MTRAFSLFSLVAALAIGGYLFTAQAGQRGTVDRQEIQATQEAVVAAATANFAQAALALEAQRIETGSYAGTDLSAVGGVLLARADGAAYCIQAGVGTAMSHQDGPGGSPLPGPC